MTTAARTMNTSRRARSARAAPEEEVSPEGPAKHRLRTTWFLGILGSLLYWLSIPPIGWWPMGWIAPIPWLWLISETQLLGHRPRTGLWVAGWVHWLLILHGLVLAHWANYFGLAALSAYLGVLLFVFVMVSRFAVHQLRMPLVIVAPIVWAGLEMARGYGPLGLSLALLGHSQIKWPAVIQIADLIGGFGVSLLMMIVAASAVDAIRQRGYRRWIPAAAAAILLAATLLYGNARLAWEADSSRTLRVALIQGSIDTTFGEDRDRPRRMLQQYVEQTQNACRRFRNLDLIIWPESMFPIYDALVTSPDPQLEDDLTLDIVAQNNDRFHAEVRAAARMINALNSTPDQPAHVSLVLGTTTWEFGDHSPRRYNAALLIDPDGNVVDRYYKMHPLLFGEYVPFGEQLPWLYRLTPMQNGLSAGQEPKCFEVAGVRASPSICFESIMPHLVRSQVATLRARGDEPDLLISLTNDGWFWGSSLLDLHLYCSAFRAVENRRPMLVAANTGLSAWVDGNGRILKQGPRRAEQTLLAEAETDGRWCLYSEVGEVPAGLCLGFVLIIGAMAVWHGRKGRDRFS